MYEITNPEDGLFKILDTEISKMAARGRKQKATLL
jgi:hypothetical protein